MENTMKKLTELMSFDWKVQQLNCVSKRNQGIVDRKKSSCEKCHFNTNSKTYIASKKISCGPNETYTINIYNKKHYIWINSAIRNIKKELEKRGLESSYISNYETKSWLIYVCPQAEQH